MIFYFTGTGNSLYVAKKLADLMDDKLVCMSEALKQGKSVFKIGAYEPVGFVFPVYFGGLPTIVKEFVSTLRFDDNPIPYIYAVITMGANIYGCDRMLEHVLDSRRLKLNCVFDLQMPDNYIIMYNPSAVPKQKKLIEKADDKLIKIVRLVKNRSRKGYRSVFGGRIMTSLMYPLYKHGRKTEKFYADYKCIGCGNCAGVCPVGAIEMYKGKPRWIADRCVHCTACINGCPHEAVQYGKRTISRRRYMNRVEL